jgi:beta-glucosidase
LEIGIFFFQFGWFACAIYHPDVNYPQVMIDRIADRRQKEGFSKSRLPEFTPEEVDYIKGTFDFGNPGWDADTSVTTYQD